MSSPTQRSLKKLRDEGYTAEVTERWIPFFEKDPKTGKSKPRPGGVRKDLFGFIDILAIRDTETLAVQTTSYTNVSERVKKIADSEYVPAIRKAGWAIHVHGWKKGANGRYICRVVDVS